MGSSLYQREGRDHRQDHLDRWLRLDVDGDQSYRPRLEGFSGWWPWSYSPSGGRHSVPSSQLALHSTGLYGPMGAGCAAGPGFDSRGPPGGETCGGESQCCGRECPWHRWIVGSFGVGGWRSATTRRCRRGAGRWKPRGCRAGTCRHKVSNRIRAEGLGGGDHATSAVSFVPESRPKEGEVQKVQEIQEEGQEIQETEEVPQVEFISEHVFQEQSIPIKEQDFQQLEFEFQKAPAMAGKGQGQESFLHRPLPRRSVEAEEAWGSVGICSKEPRSFDGSFPGGHLCEAQQRHHYKIQSAPRSQCSVVGSSVQWIERSERSEGGLDSLRDPGSCEPQGDSKGFGCVGAESCGDPGGQAEGRHMGKGRGLGAGVKPEVTGQLEHAGIDGQVRRQIRRSWHSMGGFSLQPEGFDVYFLRAMRALEVGVGVLRRGAGLGEQFKHLMKWLANESRHVEFDGSSNGSEGLSPSHVFPLAPMSREGRFLIGGKVQSRLDKLCLSGGNWVVAALNWMHGGRQQGGPPVVSAAQQRVHSRIESALEALVMTDEPTLSSSGLDQFLRQTQFYTGGGVTLALGMRGGVPEKAADVPLASHLGEHFPQMAVQVSQPKCLLLPSRRRPRRVKRGYTWLASTYPELVKRNVQAGLHRYKKGSQVAKHRGVKCLAGAFAVIKDEAEDRVITDPSVNQLLDPEKLPRPKFAFIPSLRTLSIPKDGVIAVSKRDARHYFHRLRIGKNWQKWLCGPPVMSASSGGGTKTRYPASCSAPMGFGPSAGWAQGLTDVVAIDAQLPEDCRVHPDFVVPECLPVWGSIIDDIWALEDETRTKGVGAEWLDRAESSWTIRGVQPNMKKSVNNAHGEEIQGYFVHPTKHWVGLSYEKRRFLFQASFQVLMQRRCHVKVIERLVGKHGFLHSSRPCMRSIFLTTYSWLDEVRRSKLSLVELPDSVWEELLASTLLIIFAEFSLSSEWSNRVEATDSSMTGLGRSFGYMPDKVVQAMARYSCHKNVYTNLSLPWSIGLNKVHKCPLRKIRLPVERVKWFHLGVPWSPLHITLGEADALVWAAEDRLRRPSDDGKRFIHPLDSAACCGAFSKGRSSSLLINMRCRRACSIALAGGHDVFYPWIPSGDNPADLPSRWHEPAAGVAVSAELVSEGPAIDLRTLDLWPEGTKFFLHLCSGPDRCFDLGDWVERTASANGYKVVSIRIDPLAWCSEQWTCFTSGDLFESTVGLGLIGLIHSGRVIGGFGSPPCSTISAARHVPLVKRGGPRPLRSRSNPWNALPYCSETERQAVRVGSVLFLLVLGLLGEVRFRGGWICLEHPADRGREPYPSFFCTDVVTQFKQLCKLRYFVLDQCMYGAVSRKPTGLLLPLFSHSIEKFCNHGKNHPVLIGLSNSGGFRTTPAAQYPSQFCEALSGLFIHRYHVGVKHGYALPFKTLHGNDPEFKEPWASQHHVSFPWPEPSTGFLVRELATINSRKVPGSPQAPQQ